MLALNKVPQIIYIIYIESFGRVLILFSCIIRLREGEIKIKSSFCSRGY